MLQLKNETAFQTGRAVLLDGRGAQVWVVVVKATFRFDEGGRVTLHEAQEPVNSAPLYAGDPGASSLLRDAEIVAQHPGTDVTLNATAHAPEGREVTELDVGVAVADLRRSARVLGDRRWEHGAFGLRKTPSAPFRVMPIRYERAFGGRDAGGEEARNPIGRGFATDARDLAGAPLPNIEDPGALIQDAGSRPAPVGFGAVPPQWSPRRELAGTFDEAWQTRRAPLWPADFDPRHHRSAPPGLWSERHLIGGEPVSLRHLTPAPVVSFRLPRVEVVVYTWIAGERIRQRVRLDRVVLEPDERKLVLVWRSSLDCGTEARKIARSIVTTKEVLQ
ncbi:DUF2169 domain-containing protein [Sorangium sp. So ce269]